jgi:MFS family permease
MTETRALQETPGYLFLLATRVTSSVILWVDFTLIFSLLSYYWHASATTVGFASALYGLPGLLLGPWFGRFADRHDALSVLMGSYVTRGVTSLLLIFAPNVYVFVLLVFLKGLGNLGAMPAEQILVRSMLSRGQLASNAGLMTAIDQLTKIVAPLIAAAISFSYRPTGGFGLSSALALVGLVCLVAIKACVEKPAEPATQTRAPVRFSALVSLLKKNAEFRMVFFTAVIQSAVLGLYDPLLALFLRGRGFPAATFGTIVSCTASGAFVGAVLFKRLFSGFAVKALTSGALIGFGLTVAIPGVLATVNIPIAIGFLFVLWVANGCFYGLTAMSLSVTMQATCPHESLGTVSSIARSAQMAMLVLGPLVGSGASRIVGIPVVFSISGLLAVIAGVLFSVIHYRNLSMHRTNNMAAQNRHRP